MNLILQVHWENKWRDAGVVTFHDESSGLLGKPSFSYETPYIVEALEHFGDFTAENLIDRTAVGVNLPCHFGGDYVDGEIAPVLRDIIPQGAGRRHWIRMLGLDRDPAQTIDAQLLADYLVRDVLNTAIANRDNHGRNTALIKQGKDIALAPAFDLAPMALDPEGIARTTVWPRELRTGNGMDPSYPRVINALADTPERAAGLFRDELRRLAPLREELVRQGAPALMMALPALQVDVIGQVIAEMDRMLGTGE